MRLEDGRHLPADVVLFCGGTIWQGDPTFLAGLGLGVPGLTLGCIRAVFIRLEGRSRQPEPAGGHYHVLGNHKRQGDPAFVAGLALDQISFIQGAIGSLPDE